MSQAPSAAHENHEEEQPPGLIDNQESTTINGLFASLHALDTQGPERISCLQLDSLMPSTPISSDLLLLAILNEDLLSLHHHNNSDFINDNMQHNDMLNLANTTPSTQQQPESNMDITPERSLSLSDVVRSCAFCRAMVHDVIRVILESGMDVNLGEIASSEDDCGGDYAYMDDNLDDYINIDDDYYDDDNEGSRMQAATKQSIENLEKVRIDGDLDSMESCPICFDQFSIGSEARHLPCLHVYHTDCIAKWLGKSNLCPMCRYKMPSEF